MSGEREERAKQAWIAAKEILERAPHAAEFVESWKCDKPSEDSVALLGSTHADLGWSFVLVRYEHAGRTNFTGTVVRGGVVVNLTHAVAELTFVVAERWAKDHVVQGQE